MRRIIVLLSGGLDSTAVLLAARRNFDEVFALGFRYGQPAGDQEMVAAERSAHAAGVQFDSRQLVGSVERAGIVTGAPDGLGVAPVVVPMRNAVFLTVAAGYGVAKWGGAPFSIGVGCNADDAAFDDCRRTFFSSMSSSLTLASGTQIEVWAPYVDTPKRQIVDLVETTGELDALTRSWSCYRGGAKPCGACRACLVREESFAGVGVARDLGAFPLVMCGGDPGRDAALGLR